PRVRRDLHSFPTRRSSDLIGATTTGSTAPTRSSPPEQHGLSDHPFPKGHHLDFSRPNDSIGNSMGSVPMLARSGRQPKYRPITSDRKSTRLNSSHVKISYA